MAKLRIRLVRSPIGCPEDQRATVAALGLRRLHDVRIHEDTPAVRGMANKVRHLVEVEEMAGESDAT